MTFFAHTDGYGSVVGASGYEASVTRRSDQTVTSMVSVLDDVWNKVPPDVSSWPLRNDVIGISVSYTAAASTGSLGGIHFQIEDVGWASQHVTQTYNNPRSRLAEHHT